MPPHCPYGRYSICRLVSVFRHLIIFAVKNGDNTKGKITITTNKASVLNASQINSAFIKLDKQYIAKGNLLSLEGWFRVHLLAEKSGKSVKQFVKDAEKNTTWKASTIENRISHIRWALENIQKNGKREVMYLSGDKFVTVVDSMEQIVTTRYPAQKTSVKTAKKNRAVIVKTIDENECAKRLRTVVMNGKKLSKTEIAVLVAAIMQEEM